MALNGSLYLTQTEESGSFVFRRYIRYHPCGQEGMVALVAVLTEGFMYLVEFI